MRLYSKLGLALVLATAVAGSAAAQTKVRVSTIPIIDTAPLSAAIAQGYFKQEGLDVDTTPVVGGAVGLPAVAAGQIQIGYSNIVSIVLGAHEGLGVQIIAAGSASGDAPPNTAGLIARKADGVKSGKDLEGKRVAVNTRNSINWLVVREWARLTGGDADLINFLEVPFPSIPDGVRGKQIDVGFTVEPFLSASTASGELELIGWPYDRIMKRVPISQFVATEAYAKANPKVIEAWVRAYNRGIDWVNANKGSDEWVALIAGYTKMRPEQVKTIALPLWEKTVSQEAVEKMIGVMQQHGLMKGKSNMNIDKLINPIVKAN